MTGAGTRRAALGWLGRLGLWAVLALGPMLGACSKSSPPAGSSSSAAGESDSLGQRLRAAGKGESVVFAATDAGLVAATSAGVMEVLVPGAAGDITGGQYSAADELLFFVRKDQLLVVDVRRTDIKPQALLQAVPEDAAVVIARAGLPSVRIGGPDDNLYVQLEWNAQPSARAGAENQDLVDEEELAAAAKVALAAGAAEWLAAEAKRARVDVPPKAKSIRLEGALAEAFADCEDCLEAAPFGASGWQLFVSESSCEDFCHRGCLLFDPATGQVASPLPKPEWVPADDMPEAGGCVYHFDASGKSYAAAGDSELCTVGAECRDLGGRILGFVSAGAPVDP